MKETIVTRGRAGAAVIVSSHLLHLVEEICTRIVIIDRGVKVADGTLDELRARPELAAAGIEPRVDLPDGDGREASAETGSPPAGSEWLPARSSI